MQENTNTLNYHGEEVEILFHTYEDGGNTAIILLDSDKEIYTVATTNVSYPLNPNYVAIKDYSENEGMSGFLIDNNIIQDEVITSVPSGHVVIPVFKLTNQASSKLNDIEKGDY